MAKTGRPCKPLAWEVKANGCWECTSHKATCNGYARVARDNRDILVHRYVYEQTHGPIPDGMCVLHTCDNRLCINPDHLWLGTIADNNDDRDRKGRSIHLHGEANGNSRLTEDQVRFIREHTELGKTRIARVVGVSRSVIGQIRQGKTWVHLP